MSIGEADIFRDVMARLTALETALAEDAALLGAPPQSVDEFEAMAMTSRSASRALMKSFEQFEDQVARSFRLVPTMLGVATDGWYMQDFADFMEKNGVVADADVWMAVVKLRNRLVHDYPLQAHSQFAKLAEVIERVPLLFETRRKLVAFTRNRGFGA